MCFFNGLVCSVFASWHGSRAPSRRLRLASNRPFFLTTVKHQEPCSGALTTSTHPLLCLFSSPVSPFLFFSLTQRASFSSFSRSQHPSPFSSQAPLQFPPLTTCIIYTKPPTPSLLLTLNENHITIHLFSYQDYSISHIQIDVLTEKHL